MCKGYVRAGQLRDVNIPRQEVPGGQQFTGTCTCMFNAMYHVFAVAVFLAVSLEFRHAIQNKISILRTLAAVCGERDGKIPIIRDLLVFFASQSKFDLHRCDQRFSGSWEIEALLQSDFSFVLV